MTHIEIVHWIKLGKQLRWIPKKISGEKGDPELRDLFIGDIKLSSSMFPSDECTDDEKRWGSCGHQTTLPDGIVVISPKI